MPHEQVTARQLLFLLITVRIAIGVAAMPAVVLTRKGSDAWLLGPLSALGAAVPLLAVVALQSRFPRQNLAAYARRLAGRALGGLLLLPALLVFLFNAAAVLRQYSDLMVSGPMPETPAELFAVLGALCAAYIVRLGLEPGTRLMEAALPFALTSLLFLLALGMKEMDPRALKPFLGEGWGPLLGQMPASIAEFVADLFPVVVLAARLDKPWLLPRTVLAALGVSAGLIAITAAGVTMFFSAAEARAQAFPFFGMVRAISIADIVERLDAFYLVLLTVLTVGELFVLLYCLCASLAEWGGLQDYRPLALPVAMITAVCALLLYESRGEIAEFYRPQVAPFILLPGTLGVALLLLAIAWLRGAGRRPARAAPTPAGEPWEGGP